MRTRSSKEFGAANEGTKEEATTVPKDEKEVVNVNEEAGNSDKPEYTLEDVERAKEFFAEGKRNYLCGSMAEAANTLALASEIYSGFYGETARECVEIYYYYGRTLLELARKEPDVVAGAVEGTCLDKIDSDSAGEDNDVADNGATGEADDNMTPEEVREKVMDALDENAEELEKEAAEKASKAAGKTSDAGDAPVAPDSTTGESKDGASGNVDMQEATPVVEEASSEDDTGEEDETEDKENNPAAEEETLDEISNLQLSWETLDLARVILEKCTDKESQERLADVRLALGEQAMEDEQFDKAISEFSAGLELQSKMLPEDDRRIALSHYNIGVAQNLKEEYEQAVESFQQAVRVLKLRHGNLKTKLAAEGVNETEKTELEADVSDLEALITDVESRIQDCVESRGQSDAAKKAMAEENGTKSTDGNGATGDDKGATVTDVSHLVRKSVKRASGGEGGELEEPAKKAKVDAVEVNGKNGHDNANGHKEGSNGIAAAE